jgi:hypothetical protein
MWCLARIVFGAGLLDRIGHAMKRPETDISALGGVCPRLEALAVQAKSSHVTQK